MATSSPADISEALVSIPEAIEASRQAWIADEATRVAAMEADSVVLGLLGGTDIILTGFTTHRYVPLGPDVEQRRRLVQEMVHVEAVEFDLGATPKQDKMLVVLLDGSQWLISVSGSTITIPSPGTPKDGSYVCKTCDNVVGPDEHHEHGCPMEDGDSCASRTCNILGSCQA